MCSDQIGWKIWLGISVWFLSSRWGEVNPRACDRDYYHGFTCDGHAVHLFDINLGYLPKFDKLISELGLSMQAVLWNSWLVRLIQIYDVVCYPGLFVGFGCFNWSDWILNCLDSLWYPTKVKAIKPDESQRGGPSCGIANIVHKYTGWEGLGSHHISSEWALTPSGEGDQEDPVLRKTLLIRTVADN